MTAHLNDEEIDVRKVILFANTSLDGFMGGRGGDMTWMVDDEEMGHDSPPTSV